LVYLYSNYFFYFKIHKHSKGEMHGQLKGTTTIEPEATSFNSN